MFMSLKMLKKNFFQLGKLTTKKPTHLYPSPLCYGTIEIELEKKFYRPLLSATVGVNYKLSEAF